MSTPHIDAEMGEIAPIVLFPGDPIRAKNIASTFLTHVKQINARRNMLGFSGEYQGQRISVMGSGMGIPSMSIYATELIRFYGVKKLIRIGTCGGLGNVKIGDILMGQSASTDSQFNRLQFNGYDLSAVADFELMQQIKKTADKNKIDLKMVHVFSTDCFYNDSPAFIETLKKYRIEGVEMESSGLYGIAMKEGIQAVSLLTVSDHLETNEHMSGSDREKKVEIITKLALDSFI